MDAKVGITFEDKKILYKINKVISLRENLEAICNKFSLANCEDYALKFSYATNDIHLDHYITEENFANIQDGYTLKLVESLNSVIDRIFQNMLHDRHQTFHLLFSLSMDPGFIKALVYKGRDKDVLNWLTDKYLSGKELSACLLTLLHLLKKQYVKELLPEVIQNIIMCIKSDSAPAEVQYALAVVCQILFLKGHQIIKEIIITELSIRDLIPFIWSQEHSNLQLNTMMLINAMVKTVKGDVKKQFIKELNRRKNKEYIFKHIILEKTVDSSMSHELYIYQTYILSLYSDALLSRIDLSNNLFLIELELDEDSINRSSAYIDYEQSGRSRCNSNGTILGDLEGVRLSFASLESGKSTNTELSVNLLEDQISCITYECLLHYKKHYLKNYRQSIIEENTYGPGILVTSEKVARLLAKILHVGLEPQKLGKTYLPLIFNPNLRLPVLLELFARTMWLLSKTRREMKAWLLGDFPKVLLILEKQIHMIFQLKPIDYISLAAKMMEVTYDEVDKQWQKEKDDEWTTLYNKNPCVQAIKNEYLDGNEKLIFEKRINVLQKGETFPKLPEKKGKEQYFFLRLSENKRMIFCDDLDHKYLNTNTKPKDSSYFNVSEIRHLAIGKACPHIKDNSAKSPDRAFSLILEDGTMINCLSKDKLNANLWIDGLNLLLGKTYRSEDYKKELNVLLEMDCALHLLELQDIIIPDTPPIVPPLPKELLLKPPVPPKSPVLQKRIISKKKNSNSLNI